MRLSPVFHDNPVNSYNFSIMSLKKIKMYWDFTRPFTQLPPALGMVSGGITAFGAYPKEEFSWGIVVSIILGAMLAASLNAASNGINQIFDLEIDRINKPNRELPAGRMTIPEAWGVSIFFYALTMILAYSIGMECFIIVLIGAFMTYIYSAPPFRTKRWGIAANLTIAIPRGVLLKVAGWSCVKTVMNFEPWYIGMIFGSFLLGAATTKDFSDMKGDKAQGCITLPIKYGVAKSAWIIAPFFVFPFLLMPLGVSMGYLTGNPFLLNFFGFSLSLWGAYVCLLILRRPEELATVENHISWKHMYLMMMTTQIVFALSYLF